MNKVGLPLSQDNKKDRFISFAVAFQIVTLGCKNILVQGVPSLYDINNNLNIVILGFSSLLYLLAYHKSFNRNIGGGYYMFATFIALSFLATYTLFPQNIKYLNDYVLRTVICCILTGFLISKLRTLDWFATYMLKGSYIITIALLLFAAEIRIIGHTTMSDWSTYSMSMSNVGLIAVMFQLHDYFKNKNKKSLLAALVGCIVIFLYGSRNPLLAIVAYVFIQLLDASRSDNNTSNKIVLFFACVIVCVFYGFQKQILNGTAHLLESFGLNSRTLTFLINENDADFSTGRNEIHDKLWDVIWENSLGTGIAGDEANIQELAHGLYISIFCTYGILIGAIFLIYIFAKCYAAHKKSFGINHQLLVLYFCLVFPRGFTGGDIWQSDVFWLLMGFVFFILTNKQRLSNRKKITC